ncbi:MAG: YceI family protein [Desulfacinum sp.]|jgi:polyisoprenoid-binding protein YceI|nr:YceI family protein [Desulfacinum sp.]MBZ4658834.1 polyisoprenoid-binding protein [Desulfacinum sp.]
MGKRILVMALVCYMIAQAGLGWSQDRAWTFDPAHTSLTFTIRHVLAKVAGTFDEIQGEVVFDPSHPEQAKMEVRIPVRSINTRVERRDAHLRSPDFFDTERYPWITFASHEVRSGKNVNEFLARGTLTIKNVSRSLDLPFIFLGVQTDPFDPNKEIAGFEGHVTLDRLEFGVGNGEFFRKGLMGKEVDVAIYLEMVRGKNPAGP